MIARILAISLLVAGLCVSTRAIATTPVKAIVEQIDLNETDNLITVNHAVNDQLLGVLAICLLATPALGCAVYKQHLVYRKAIHHNKVETLERVWNLPSEIK